MNLTYLANTGAIKTRFSINIKGSENLIMPSAETAVRCQLFLLILTNLSEFGPLIVCTSYVLNYIKRMGDMIRSFVMMVLARCLNMHVPKCFWLQGWILHCGQRPRAEVWIGVQQD